MHLITAWCGFVGAWVLVAGPAAAVALAYTVRRMHLTQRALHVGEPGS